jgi:hypothetical protein
MVSGGVKGFESSPFFKSKSTKGPFHEETTQNALSMLPMGQDVLLRARNSIMKMAACV